jgi:cytochrome P450
MPERVGPEIAFRYLGGMIENLYAFAQGTVDRTLPNLVFDPAVFDEIVRRPEMFEKDFSLVGAFGASRFDTNGPEWEIRRGLTQRLYAAAATPADHDAVSGIFTSAFADRDAVTPDRLPRTLLICSLNVFFRALGCTPDCEAVADLLTRMRGTVACLQYLSWQPGDPADLAAARADAAEILSGFDAVFRADPATRELLAGFERYAAGVPGFSATSELAVAAFAADTVNAATGWALDRLGTHSGAQERLFAELASGADDTPFLDCFINETLRYFPDAARDGARRTRRKILRAGRSSRALDHRAPSQPRLLGQAGNLPGVAGGIHDRHLRPPRLPALPVGSARLRRRPAGADGGEGRPRRVHPAV